jgi:hypothetical protein
LKSWLDLLGAAAVLNHLISQPSHLLGILGLHIDLNGSQGITMSKGVNSTAQDRQQQQQVSGG